MTEFIQLHRNQIWNIEIDQTTISKNIDKWIKYGKLTKIKKPNENKPKVLGKSTNTLDKNLKSR